MESTECMRTSVLDRLVKYAGIEDIMFATDFTCRHDASSPLLHCLVRWHDTTITSRLVSTSSQWFMFQVPELASKVLNEEAKHDIASGIRSKIRRDMMSSELQQEIVQQMIACKKPDDVLYVEKYPDWTRTVVIPAVSCLEELEMLLDLHLC